MEPHGEAVVLNVAGEIDLATAPQLGESINAAMEQRPETLVVDLSKVDFLASAGMAVLIGCHQQAQGNIRFRIVATGGTARAIRGMGIPVERINKIAEGSPHVLDWIERGDVDLVINTPTGTAARSDGYEIRRASVARGIPCITTLSGGMAAARAVAAVRVDGAPVVSLQELHRNGSVTPA